MKKLLSTIAIIALFATATKSYSQTNNLFAVNTDKVFRGSISNTSKIKTADVNVNAQKNFKKSFHHVTNAKWFKIQGGSIANFLSEGIDYRIAYNDKGKWQYDLLTYSEDKLPRDIRSMVKMNYYDSDIEYCSEYKANNLLVYVITLKNPESMNTFKLKIADGEMEILTDN